MGMMIEQREFTKEEFYTILELAPEDESDNLIRYTLQIGKYPWDFFKEFCIGHWGIIIDGVPIYVGCLYEQDDTFRMWTLKNKVIKNKFTFFKLCKRKLQELSNKYSPIITYNHSKYKDVIKWNMRLGFTPVAIENDIIEYKLGG